MSRVRNSRKRRKRKTRMRRRMENRKHNRRKNRGLHFKAKKEGEESPSISPKSIEKEATTTLTALSTPIKTKGKRQRQTPLYFRRRKSTRIRQGRPKTPNKILFSLKTHQRSKKR